jgi:hypothetical protein
VREEEMMIVIKMEPEMVLWLRNPSVLVVGM